MPFHLDVLKRHSDPAPCISKSSAAAAGGTTTRSDPDLRALSPLKSPAGPRTTPGSSPARRKSCRRLSGPPPPGGRRATHPSASPRAFRRWSLWMEEEQDPWTQFRLKGLGCAFPNGDDKPFMTATDGACYRLRSFSVTSKGVVRHGDFLRSRSHSDASSEDLVFGERRSSAASTSSSAAARYRVLLLGAEEVGKTSLVAQFAATDALAEPGTSSDQSEKTVSVLVDGEESELLFEETAYPSLKADEYSGASAFLVVYSLSDRKSFREAASVLADLRAFGRRAEPGKAVILVANKVDLVRCRLVTAQEGRSLADEFGVKYVETSAGFSHNMDELLVGLVAQIRLHQAGSGPSASLGGKARGLVDRLLQKCELKARSCVNLHVL